MSGKGKVESPIDIEGFKYFYIATTICSVSPTDTPAKHFTDKEPHGKHKLKRGGYRCIASKFCGLQAYCYDCAVNQLGHHGRPTLQEYHGNICKANTGAVNPSLKRQIQASSPQPQPPATKKQRMDSDNLSSPPESPGVEDDPARLDEASPSKQRLCSKIGTESSTKIDPIEEHDEPDIYHELSGRRKKPVARPKRTTKVWSSSDEDFKPNVLPSISSDRNKAPQKASVKNLPKPPVPPQLSSSDPHDLPGASWPSNNFISRTPDPYPSRAPATFKPTGGEHRKLPTSADFFTREPDGKGSWRFPDDTFFGTESMKHDHVESIPSESQDWRMKQKRSDATEIQEFRERMTRIVRNSKPWKEGKTWYQDKRSSPGFKQAQSEVKERREAWEKANLGSSRAVASSAEERFERPLTDADHYQVSIAGRDCSINDTEEYKPGYLEIPGAIVDAANRVRRAQTAALTSQSRPDNIPYAEPGSLNAHYPKLHRPAKAAHPASTARALQKRRLAERDNPAGLDENLLRNLHTHDQLAATPYALRNAIAMTESLLPMLFTDTMRPQFEDHLEELQKRLVSAEASLASARAPETPEHPSKRHSATPVSPRPRKDKRMTEEKQT